MWQKASFTKKLVFTPHQNGVVERKYQHILNVGRVLKYQSSILLPFWGYCIKHATSFINISSSPLLKHKSLYEPLYSKKPIYPVIKSFWLSC